MNRHLYCLLLIALTLLLAAPVHAAVQSGDVSSQTDLLNSDVLTNLGKNKIPSVHKETGYSPSVLVLTDTNGKDLDTFVEEIHKYITSDTTIRLVLYVSEDTLGGLDIIDYSVYTKDDTLKEFILLRVEPYLTRANWSGVLSDDINAFDQVTDAFLNAITDFANERIETEEKNNENSTTSSVFVSDLNNIVSEDGAKILMLNSEARELSLMLNIGVYALITTTGDESISTFAENYYTEKELGLGKGKSGMLLVIDSENDEVTFYATDDVKEAIRSKERSNIVRQVSTSVKKGQISEGIEEYLTAVKSCYEESNEIDWNRLFGVACILIASFVLIKNANNVFKNKKN